jgi:SAM-dependent methyltransferase
MPFADASFDAVFGKWILHHLDLDRDLPDIVRVLKPRGRAAFVEPLIHNPVLQIYRRLTPHLRSPGERALSMADLGKIGSHFRSWQHEEFVLFSVLPASISVLIPGRLPSPRLREWFHRFDRRLLETLPFLRRYCWEAVILLER